jgi:hypothetical protein
MTGNAIDIRQIIVVIYEDFRLLVTHLNAIYARVESSTTLLEKVYATLEWKEARDCTVCRLQHMVKCLQFINTEPISELHAKELEDLRDELFATTIDSIKDGFVRETSFSETGRMSEFFSEFQSGGCHTSPSS